MATVEAFGSHTPLLGGADTPITSSGSQSGAASGLEVEFEPRAYVKMIFHAAKYPHCAVNGLLLANKKAAIRGSLAITDCIPLFHQTEGLTPMVEVALAQIESRSERAGLYVAGFYHAARSMRDCATVDVFSQKIADKVAENAASAAGAGHPKNRPVVLVTVDNKRLALVLESHALLVQMVKGSEGGGNQEGGGSAGKWRHLAAKNIGVDEDTLAMTSEMVQRKFQKDLIDFDNHLDDVTQDYLNVDINYQIEKYQ